MSIQSVQSGGIPDRSTTCRQVVCLPVLILQRAPETRIQNMFWDATRGAKGRGAGTYPSGAQFLPQEILGG